MTDKPEPEPEHIRIMRELALAVERAGYFEGDMPGLQQAKAALDDYNEFMREYEQ